MTVLSAAQSALIRLIGKKPSTIFSSQEQTVVEIADLVTEVGSDIAKSHDWQALTKIESITGDGVASAFPLPPDFDRMGLAQDVSDAKNWFWYYTKAPDLNTWIALQDGYYLGSVPPGWWIILEDQFNFLPIPTAGADAKYPYISKNFAKDENGVPKPAFTNDLDTFVLDERLLTLGLIWRWRAQKRLEYAEDLQTYEIALSQSQARDGGARALRSRPTRMLNASWAYPWPLGPNVP